MVYIQCVNKIESFLFLEYMTMGFWFFKQTMTATATRRTKMKQLMSKTKAQ